MPNYVHSTLILNGSKKDIKGFREKFEKDGKLQANTAIPYPRDLELLDKKNQSYNEKIVPKLTDEEEKELVIIGLEGKYDMSSDGYNQGGYDWCIANWGTKWGFCDCSAETEEDEYMMYRFSTAWSPISPVIVEMSKQFPKITFDYFCDEEGGEFRFEITYLNGVETDYEDLTHECEEERRQEEADLVSEQEESRRIEEKLAEKKEESKNRNKNNGEKNG